MKRMIFRCRLAGRGVPTSQLSYVRAIGAYFPANGRFYSIGGRSSDHPAGSDITHPFEYNPATNTWTTKASTLPDIKVNNMACGVLTVGGTPQIYCVGGSGVTVGNRNGRVFSYNPATDTFTTLTAGDDWPGASASFLPGGFAVAGNKLYIIGSFNTHADRRSPRRPGSSIRPQRWVRAGSRARISRGAAMCLRPSIGGIIYTGGGLNLDLTIASNRSSTIPWPIPGQRSRTYRERPARRARWW